MRALYLSMLLYHCGSSMISGLVYTDTITPIKKIDLNNYYLKIKTIRNEF